MPMWRCPHCGTPQAETARCWVCRRSSTACATCRHFRRSIAGTLGYCGIDPRRTPLSGDEIRSCWEARAVEPEPVASTPGTAPYLPPPTRAPVTFTDRSTHREFVEVGARSSPAPRRRAAASPNVTAATLGDAAAPGSSADPATDGASRRPDGRPGAELPAAPLTPDGEPRWNLWGELDG